MRSRSGWLAVLGLLVLGSLAEAGIGVSVGFGFPIGRPYGPPLPYYPPPPLYHPAPYVYYPYYRPYPYYVAPVAVDPYYEPARIVVAQEPPVAPPAAAPVRQVRLEPQPQQPQPIARASHQSSAVGEGDPVANVKHPEEHVRLDAVTQLSRSASPQAIDALNAALTRDPIPAVRDAAARALGVLGKPGGLNALRSASANDPDPEVRRSAQYSIQVIQNQLRGGQ